MNEMNDFERALTKALRSVQPPETLTKLLMAAAEVEAKRTVRWRDRKHRWAWSVPRVWFGPAAFATAALLLLGVVGGERVHRQHEHERATQEFETATRITDKALEHTREQLARAGVRLEE